MDYESFSVLISFCSIHSNMYPAYSNQFSLSNCRFPIFQKRSHKKDAPVFSKCLESIRLISSSKESNLRKPMKRAEYTGMSMLMSIKNVYEQQKVG